MKRPNNNKFKNKFITTIQQANRLRSLGLKIETADLYINCLKSDKNKTVDFYVDFNINDFIHDGLLMLDQSFCVYSLTRLLDLLPDFNDGTSLSIVNKNWIQIEGKQYNEKFYKHDNLIDNIIDCIEWSISNDIFDKDLIEEPFDINDILNDEELCQKLNAIFQK